MTVAELIAALQELPQDRDVWTERQGPVVGVREDQNIYGFDNVAQYVVIEGRDRP